MGCKSNHLIVSMSHAETDQTERVVYYTRLPTLGLRIPADAPRPMMRKCRRLFLSKFMMKRFCNCQIKNNKWPLTITMVNSHSNLRCYQFTESIRTRISERTNVRVCVIRRLTYASSMSGCAFIQSSPEFALISDHALKKSTVAA